MENTALVIIDLQKDYFPGGRFVLPNIEAAAEKAAEVLRFFRETGRPVFHVRHIELDAEAPFFAQDTEGSEIHPAVAPNPSEPLIVKHYPNSFRDTELFKELMRAGIHSLVIVGAMSNMCIDASVRSAADNGFDCLVVHDACAACEIEFNGKLIPAEDVHASFMGALAAGYAAVISAAECIKGVGAE